MTVHNNIVKMQVANNEEVNKWFKYMRTVTILNAWDNSCATLNGCDFDGDTIMTTNNPYVLKGIHKTLPICCLQGSATKTVPTEQDFIRANKASFGNAVGTITNYATSMYNVISNFEPGSKEHEELSYRLICMQDYQQAEIDKAKGCLARPVLKEWYDFKVNKILPEDDEEIIKEKEFNLSILASKKPYFFIYNYDKLKAEYMEYYKFNNQACKVKYKCEIHELYKKENKTMMEKEFIANFEFGCPVNYSPCLCNKIAWIIEDHFRNVKFNYKLEDFDCNLLKNPEVKYSKAMYKKVEDIKKEYDKVSEKSTSKSKNLDSYEINQLRALRAEEFERMCLEVSQDEQKLCNIIVDLCYASKKGSKQFAWAICGDTMIDNLLKHNNHIINYPVQSEDGDITYKGLTFKMEELVYETDSE